MLWKTALSAVLFVGAAFRTFFIDPLVGDKESDEDEDEDSNADKDYPTTDEPDLLSKMLTTCNQ